MQYALLILSKNISRFRLVLFATGATIAFKIFIFIKEISPNDIIGTYAVFPWHSVLFWAVVTLVLIPSLVQEDPHLSPDAFWKTRPIPFGALAASNLCLALMPVVLVSGVESFLLYINGLSGFSSALIFIEKLITSSLIIITCLTLASNIKSIITYVASVIFLLVIFFKAIPWETPRSNPYDFLMTNSINLPLVNDSIYQLNSLKLVSIVTALLISLAFFILLLHFHRCFRLVSLSMFITTLTCISLGFGSLPSVIVIVILTLLIVGDTYSIGQVFNRVSLASSVIVTGLIFLFLWVGGSNGVDTALKDNSPKIAPKLTSGGVLEESFKEGVKTLNLSFEVAPDYLLRVSGGRFSGSHIESTHSFVLSSRIWFPTNTLRISKKEISHFLGLKDPYKSINEISLAQSFTALERESLIKPGKYVISGEVRYNLYRLTQDWSLSLDKESETRKENLLINYVQGLKFPSNARIIERNLFPLFANLESLPTNARSGESINPLKSNQYSSDSVLVYEISEIDGQSVVKALSAVPNDVAPDPSPFHLPYVKRLWIDPRRESETDDTDSTIKPQDTKYVGVRVSHISSNTINLKNEIVELEESEFNESNVI